MPACVHTKSIQSCLTFCDPMDCSPLSMGYPRKENWSGFPCLPPEDLPNPGIEPMSLRSPAMAGGLFTISATWEAPNHDKKRKKMVLILQSQRNKQTKGHRFFIQFLTNTILPYALMLN